MSDEQVSDALKRKYNTFDEQLKAMAEVAKYDTGVNLQDWLKVLDICYTLYKISDAI